MGTADLHAYLEQLRLHAQFLEQSGYLRDYLPKQRDELIRKGYLGPHPPHEALLEARRRIEARAYRISPNALDRMRSELGAEPSEAGECLEAVVREVRPDHYRPPRKLHRPPGMPFVWKSIHFGRQMYLKFSFVTEKDSLREARLYIHSCHPSDDREGDDGT